MRLIALVSLCAALASAQPAARPDPPRSGSEFTPEGLRALQADDFANPAMLWVERGEAAWREKAGRAVKSCADCHGDAATTMKGAAARFPRVDAETGKLLDLEGRINVCREGKQQAAPLAPESPELLALSAYVARQSRGVPIAFSGDPRMKPAFERGRALYHERIGQMNLACAHCHDRSWGRRLYAETISQGQPNGWPAYRVSWESIGSLARRLRACFYGVRAEMPEYGSQDLLDLEVYLAWRADGLAMEAPAVRR